MQGIALQVAAYEPERSDEHAVFERILAQCERRVLRIALRLLNDEQDAQDAAQEAFLRLYRNLRSLDTDRCEPWLIRVTVNVCRDMARSRRRSAVLDGVPEPAAPGPDAQAVLERAQERRILRRALAGLGEKERAALVLRDLEGLSTREVAAILGSREATVRSQICSARLKIRQYVVRLIRRRP